MIYNTEANGSAWATRMLQQSRKRKAACPSVSPLRALSSNWPWDVHRIVSRPSQASASKLCAKTAGASAFKIVRD